MRKLFGLVLIIEITVILFGTGVLTHAQDSGSAEQNLRSPYTGQEHREIRTLSEEDIRQLKNGDGWGLAKAAELNGFPGPAHLIEMEEQGAIHLSDEQDRRIRGLYREMKDRAVQLGTKLIEQERELNLLFSSGDIDKQKLRSVLSDIAATRAELRFIHLSAHLEVSAVLSPHQIERYNTVRGYNMDKAGKGDHGHSFHDQ